MKQKEQDLSQDEILAEEHDRYIQLVTESGIPLWILETYY